MSVLSEAPDLPGYVISEMHHHPERFEQLIESLAGVTPREFAPRIVGKLGEQIDEEVRAGRLRPVAPEEFLVNLVSLCIYPFAARPMLEVLIGGGGGRFDEFIEVRKRSLPGFFLNALRP